MRINKKIDELILNSNNSIYISIARYIKEHQEDFLNNNIKTVAKNCNVSTATITRFCQSLDLKGFNELKYNLKIANHQINDGNPDLGDFYQEYHHLKVLGSKKILSLTKQLSGLKELIEQSAKTFIFGFNLSYNATKNFVQGMRIFNYQVYLETDPSLIEWYLNNLKDDDLVIFLTLSGENTKIFNYLKLIESHERKVLISGKKIKESWSLTQMIVFELNEEEDLTFSSLRSQNLQQIWDFVYYNICLKPSSN